MEALTPNFLQFLNRELPPHAVITADDANYMFDYYQKENRLRHDIRIAAGMDFDYNIFQNHQSTFSNFDRDLVTGVRPYKTVLHYGVPLIYVYKKDSLGASLFSE